MAGLHAEFPQPAPVGSILSSRAVEFLHALDDRFAPRRKKLLEERLRRQQQFDQGHFPEFLAGDRRRHDPEWMVAPVPEELIEQRVMVTGAPRVEVLSRSSQSGASGFVADFDDCSSPVWTKCLEEHANLRQATSRLTARSTPKPAVIFLRPRNWLLEERHFSRGRAAIPASLFDFGVYFIHNAAALVASGRAPCFSLPKLESHREARLWKEIFAFSEEFLGIPHGSIRALVTIETLSAAFEMEEILFELRDYAFALGCSPSNYLSGYIQALRAHGEYLLPELNDLSMEQPFLHAYRELLVHTCHKRGAHAIGACYPAFPAYDSSRRSLRAETAMTAARLNAAIECEMGFDGTSVAEADLAAALVADSVERIKGRRTIKPRSMKSKPALRQCYISATDLISRARGRITAAALKENVETALGHLEAWLSDACLSGNGAGHRSPGAGSMAAAELCRAQLWQWIRHSARLTAGDRVDRNLVECLVREFSAAAQSRLGEAEFAASKFSAAGEILLDGCTGDLESPLALRAYAHVA